MSLGYAPSYRLGELSGLSPAGAYLSLDFMRAGKGPEVELAYRRDTREPLDSWERESFLTLSVDPQAFAGASGGLAGVRFTAGVGF